MIFVTNQTTLSVKDLDRLFLAIKEKYPKAIISDEICNATRKRQEAIINQNSEVDLCVIVGDKLSNNTKNLAKIANQFAKVNTIMIESLADLDVSILKNVTLVSVSSGASTPTWVTNEVIHFLRQFNYNDLKTWVKDRL